MFERSDSVEPLVQKSALHEHLLVHLLGNGAGITPKWDQVGVGDSERSLADRLPLQICDQCPIFTSDRVVHRGSGRVAGRAADIRVGLAVFGGPDDRLQVAIRAGERLKRREWESHAGSARRNLRS